MKYSSKKAPLVCMQKNSTCYKNTTKMTIKGILWHSTGANNPTLRRYVQPSKSDKNYSTLIKKIGVNSNGNDWNHIKIDAGLNAWIGQLNDGTIATVQTMPWDYKPWGCGGGSKGSCNDGWIQFEICEDSLSNKNYFNAVYKEACELTAYLCKKYNLNPKGTVTKNGVKIPVILCHWDSYKLGMGSSHSDVYHWFNKYGKTMDDVRKDVAALMKSSSAKKEDTKKISTTKKEETKKTTSTAKKDTSYKVQVTTPKGLNIRKSASISSSKIGILKPGEKVTISKKEGKWGYISSKKGWICLDYTKKI